MFYKERVSSKGPKLMMTLHTHIYMYLTNLFGIHFAFEKWKGCSTMGERKRARGKGEGGLWEGEHLDNVNSGI